MIDQHRIEIKEEVGEIVGGWDRMRIERELTNLLSNAINDSPEGGQITISVRSQDGPDGVVSAIITVTDEGMGIAAADLPHFFEPFRRGSNVARNAPGTGIGIAGAKQIVEQHGGAITVDSREGHGTSVTVRLPIG